MRSLLSRNRKMCLQHVHARHWKRWIVMCYCHAMPMQWLKKSFKHHAEIRNQYCHVQYSKCVICWSWVYGHSLSFPTWAREHVWEGFCNMIYLCLSLLQFERCVVIHNYKYIISLPLGLISVGRSPYSILAPSDRVGFDSSLYDPLCSAVYRCCMIYILHRAPGQGRWRRKTWEPCGIPDHYASIVIWIAL